MRSLLAITLLALAASLHAQEQAIAPPAIQKIQGRANGITVSIVAPAGQSNQLWAVTRGDDPTTHTSAVVQSVGPEAAVLLDVKIPHDETTTCSLYVRYGIPPQIAEIMIDDAATLDLFEAVDREVLIGLLKAQPNARTLRSQAALRLIDAIQEERAAVDAELEVMRAERIRQIEAKAPVAEQPGSEDRIGRKEARDKGKAR